MQIFFSFFFAENVIFKGNFYLLILKKEKKNCIQMDTKNKKQEQEYEIFNQQQHLGTCQYTMYKQGHGCKPKVNLYNCSYQMIFKFFLLTF